MKVRTKFIGATFAAAAALAFLTNAGAQDRSVTANAKWVKCAGINACRGQSKCMLTTNTCRILNKCKGQNGCKGKGFVWKTPANCKNAGGTAPENPAAMK